MNTKPAFQPPWSPVAGVVNNAPGKPIFPKTGDYLLTKRGGDYLTDELGNRLTA